jgi:hypothetical protein
MREYETQRNIENPNFVIGLAADQLLPEICRAISSDVAERAIALDIVSIARTERQNIGIDQLDTGTRELARVSDVVSMAGQLARNRFFNNGLQVRDLVESVWDSTYSPIAVVRAVQNPDKYIDKGANVSPEVMTNLTFLWGECEFSFVGDAEYVRGMNIDEFRIADQRARTSVPSLRMLWNAAQDLGLDLSTPLTIEGVDELISRYGFDNRPRRMVTPRLYSDPNKEIVDREKSTQLMSFLDFGDGRTSDEPGWKPVDPDEDSYMALAYYGDYLDDDPDFRRSLSYEHDLSWAYYDSDRRLSDYMFVVGEQ